MDGNGEHHANDRKLPAAARGMGHASPFDRLQWFDLLAAHGFAGEGRFDAAGFAGETAAWLPLRREKSSVLAGLVNWYSFAIRPLYTGQGDHMAALRDLFARARPEAARLTLYPVPDAEKDSIAAATAFDADAWAAYEHIYAASWKPEEGDPALLRAFAESESARGTFRMGLARIDGAAVAAQYWTVEDGTAFIHKLAHVEDSLKASPGTLLSAALFRHVITVDGVRRIDFGTGNDAYKRDWMNRHEPLWRLEGFNRGRIAAWGPALKAFARSLLRKDT